MIIPSVCVVQDQSQVSLKLILQVFLPFPFEGDFYPYDSIQIQALDRRFQKEEVGCLVTIRDSS